MRSSLVQRRSLIETPADLTYFVQDRADVGMGRNHPVLQCR